MKRADVEVIIPGEAKPTWATVFDYYYPRIVTAQQPVREFVAVHGPLADRQSKARKMYVKHLVEDNPTKYNHLFITKYPRQGAYDNIHITGDMGKHVGFAEQAATQRQLLAIWQTNQPAGSRPPQLDVADIANEDVVAAPFCGTDCFHLHWRWSLLTEDIASKPGLIASPNNYRGWGKGADGIATSHHSLGAPLIPPNQELRIRFEALTSPSTMTNMMGETTEEQKVLEYKVKIISPAPDENQVILEQGMGWAMIYSSQPTVSLAELSVLELAPIPKTTPTLFDYGLLGPRDHMAMFDKLYDFIRFHHSYSGNFTPYDNATLMKIHNHVQVPTGQDLPTLTWPVGDASVDFYRQRGAAFFNSGPYGPDEQVVVDSTNPVFDNFQPVNIENM